MCSDVELCPSSLCSAVTVVGSPELPWAAVSPPARVISTSCALEPNCACSSRTGRSTATSTGSWLVQRWGQYSVASLLVSELSY